jgi:hypothetical protein
MEEIIMSVVTVAPEAEVAVVVNHGQAEMLHKVLQAEEQVTEIQVVKAHTTHNQEMVEVVVAVVPAVQDKMVQVVVIHQVQVVLIVFQVRV